MQYLYEEQHYIDLYDLLTIKDCLRIINFWQSTFDKKRKEKGINVKNLWGASYYGLNIELYLKKAEWWEDKKKSINEWMERDRQKQDKYENTPHPDMRCSLCGKYMVCEDKILEDYSDDQQMRMLFLFRCDYCHKNKAVYEDGKEKNKTEHKCPKCNATASFTLKVKGTISTWTTKCSSCGFFEEEVEDDAEWGKKHRKEEQENKELLEKYRADFCLSDEQGKKDVDNIHQQTIAMKQLEELQQKQADPIYQKAMKIKKLTIVELENILSPIVEKEKYIKLSFGKPELERDVRVPFTVQDADSSRKQYDSVHTLQKLIKTTLEGTNWHLMSEGISYRLGYLSGRLRGVEIEDDLVEMVKEEGNEDIVY